MSEVVKMNRVLERRKQSNEWSVIKIFQFIFIEKKVFLFIIALLLGRAVILYNISPFALAFLATAWATRQKRMMVLVALTFIGAVTFSVEQGSFVLLSSILFFLFTRFLQDRSHLKFIILFVFLSTVLTNFPSIHCK